MLNNDKRLEPYGALANGQCELTISEANKLLIQENILLRTSVQQILPKMDQLTKENNQLIKENDQLIKENDQLIKEKDQVTKEKDHFCKQSQTYHLLYVQLKHDRNKIARQLTTKQRELEYQKRANKSVNQMSALYHRRKHRRLLRGPASVGITNSYNKGVFGNNFSGKYHHPNELAKFVSSSNEHILQPPTYHKFDTPDLIPIMQAPMQLPNSFMLTTGSTMPMGDDTKIYNDLLVNQKQMDFVANNQHSSAKMCPTEHHQQKHNNNVQQTYVYTSTEIDEDSDAEIARYKEEIRAQTIANMNRDNQQRPKLMYQRSLRKSVEFSRSMLHLSKRKIVGAEHEQEEYQQPEQSVDEPMETIENATPVFNFNSEHRSQRAITDVFNLTNNNTLDDQRKSQNDNIIPIVQLKVENSNIEGDIAIPLQKRQAMHFDLNKKESEMNSTLMICDHQAKKKVKQEKAFKHEGDDNQVLVEDAIPVVISSSPSPPPVSTIKLFNDNFLPNSIVYNSSDYSIDYYVREVKLQNKPKEFLGIFFESAFSTGVVVQKVIPSSIAARAGLATGDRVLEMCGINLRKANFRLAEKIIKECETDFITFKVVSHQTSIDDDSNVQKARLQKSQSNQPNFSNNNDGGDNEDDNNGSIVRFQRGLSKTCTLTRKEAFKNKLRLHAFFGRKQSKEAMLYQTCHLAVRIPRRITVTQSLAKIKLLGGNAMGIYVHSITDDFLANLLQKGDQLLEYNNFDLTKATAEDAAIELAKPARNSVLVALFNLDGYNETQERALGDSFYIRAEFTRESDNKSLEFKKGDILYVDNTLYDGKPGRWRAWQVNEFGKKTACGVIPSKYNAECEYLQQLRSQKQSKFKRFNMFAFLKPIFFFRTKNGYSKLADSDKKRVLASFSCHFFENNNNNNQQNVNSIGNDDDSFEQFFNFKSYQMVDMIPLRKPRPVLVYGPCADLIMPLLESHFQDLFKQCTREQVLLSDNKNKAGPSSAPNMSEYLHCTTKSSPQQDNTTQCECLSVESVNKIIDSGLHPVIEVISAATVAQFRSHNLFPIVVSLKFRSIKHIKETVNKYKFNRQTHYSYKQAKANYQHMLKIETEMKEETHVTIVGNNLTYMCTQMKESVLEEQDKVIWSEVKQ